MNSAVELSWRKVCTLRVDLEAFLLKVVCNIHVPDQYYKSGVVAVSKFHTGTEDMV